MSQLFTLEVREVESLGEERREIVKKNVEGGQFKKGEAYLVRVFLISQNNNDE